jgi:hypothetical protein
VQQPPPGRPTIAHSSELPFLFGTGTDIVSTKMQTYGANCVRTGNPNGEGVPPRTLRAVPANAARAVMSRFAILGLMADRFRDVGGTPGGLGVFVMGFAMACMGAYLLTNQVYVVGSYWSFYGGNTFGLTLLPMLFGIGLLFFSGRSTLGWLLTIAGAVIILAGVLMNMHIYFQPTTLFHTLIMLTLLAGGLGLIARSVR